MMMSLAIIYLLKNFYSNEMVNKEALNIYTKDNQKAKYENYTNNPT